MTLKLDARGLSCPEPVIITKKVIEKDKVDMFTIIVDAHVAVENISRFVKSKGYNISISELEEEYSLEISK